MRNTLKSNIIQVIKNNKNFDESDFSFSEKYSRTVCINYEYNTQYYFQFSIPSESTEKEIIQNNKSSVKTIYKFNGTMRPGKYNDTEDFNVESFSVLVVRISEWLVNLDTELSSMHVFRKLNIQNAKIEEMKKNMAEFLENANDETKKSAEQYFSEEEIININKKLDNIENVLIEKIKEYENIEKERDKQIEELKKDIEKMRKASNSMDKKNWLKKLLTIAITWSTDPIKQKQLISGSKLLIQIVKYTGLGIPDQITEFLPEDTTQFK